MTKINKITTTAVVIPAPLITYYLALGVLISAAEAIRTRPQWLTDLINDPVIGPTLRQWPEGGGWYQVGANLHNRSTICCHSICWADGTVGCNACLGGQTQNHGSVVDRAETNGKDGIVFLENGATAKGYSKVIGNVTLRTLATLKGQAEIRARSFIDFISGVIKDNALLTDYVVGTKGHGISYSVEGAFGRCEIGGSVKFSGPKALQAYVDSLIDVRGRLESQN